MLHFLVSRAAVLLLLHFVSCWAAISYPTVTHGGVCSQPAACPCQSRLTENGTRASLPLRLQFHPAANPLPPSSFFTSSSQQVGDLVLPTLVVVSGAPMPPIVLQFVARSEVSNSTCTSDAPWTSASRAAQHPLTTPERSLTGPLVNVSTATVTLVTESLIVPTWNFSGGVAFAAGGELVIHNLTVIGAEGTEFYFRINTSVGLWVVSPSLILVQNDTDSDNTLTIVETGSNILSSLGCFAFPVVADNAPIIQSLSLVVKRATGFRSRSFDGAVLHINASYDSDTPSPSRPTELSVTTSVLPLVRDGYVQVRDMTLTVRSTVEGISPAYYNPVVFTFTLFTPTGVLVAAARPMLLIPAPMLAFSIRFGRSSYLQDPSAEVHIPEGPDDAEMPPTVSAVIGVPLRRTVVHVVDSSGAWDRTVSGVFVVATCSSGSLTGASALVLSGVAVFDRLTFVAADSVENGTSTAVGSGHVLTFRCDEVVFSRPLYSQRVLVSTPDVLRRPFSLQVRSFDNALFLDAQDNYVLPAARTLRRALVVTILGRDGLINPTASCNISVAGYKLLSTDVLVRPVAGVASFTGLRFANVTSGEVGWLRFACVYLTPGPNGTLTRAELASTMVAPVTLLSLGHVTLLRFEPTSLNWLGAPMVRSFATHGSPVPPVVIELLNAEGEVNVSVTGMEVQAFCDSSDVRLSGAVAVVHNGRAMFTELALWCVDRSVADCLTRLYFVLRSSDVALETNTIDEGLTLFTGDVSVTHVVQARFDIKFTNSSFIQYASQPIAASFNYTLPPVCIGVYSSDHRLDASTRNALVTASISSGSLAGATQLSLIGVSEVCFSNLVITTSVAPFEPRLTFCVVRDLSARSSAAQSQLTPMLEKCVASGVVTFQLPAEPMRLTLIPLREADGALVDHTLPSTAGANDGGTYDAVWSVNSTCEDVVVNPLRDAVSVRVAHVNGALRWALPTPATLATAVVNLTSTLSVGAVLQATFLSDTRPAVYPQRPFAEFRAVSLSGYAEGALVASSRFISGLHHRITITSAWAPARLLRIGNVFVSGGTADASDLEPVLCVVVGTPCELFDVHSWITTLARQLNVPARRVDVLRIRPTGSATTGAIPVWTATRLELRFLVPSTEDPLAATAEELSRALTTRVGVCQQDDLRIMNVFSRDGPQPFCDMFRLDEQIASAHLCVGEGADLCGCFVALFQSTPSSCGSLDAIATICTVLKQCTNSHIANGCSAYRANVALQYALIGVYCVLGALVLAMVYLWHRDWFHKLCRNTLGNRNRRDFEFTGLQLHRSQGEKEDAGETFM